MRSSAIKFTGRVILKQTKPGYINKMKVYLVEQRKHDFGCEQVPSLHSEGLDCIVSFTLTDPDGINGKLRPGYRPVPGVPFHYKLDTVALKAEPISRLCGDFIISFLHREEDLASRDGLNTTVYSMELQWGTKFLGQLTRSALIFPPFPLTPKQSCSLCTPVHFTLS